MHRKIALDFLILFVKIQISKAEHEPQIGLFVNVTQFKLFLAMG